MELKHILNSINYDKIPLFNDEQKADKHYPAFIVNRCLSFFNDTIFYANEMNCKSSLDKQMQFDYYRFAIRKKKRFSPWIKKQTEENISLIKQVYGYTDIKAQEVLNIFGPSDLETLKSSLHKGGANSKE